VTFANGVSCGVGEALGESLGVSVGTTLASGPSDGAADPSTAAVEEGRAVEVAELPSRLSMTTAVNPRTITIKTSMTVIAVRRLRSVTSSLECFCASYPTGQGRHASRPACPARQNT
jgi:hypothetical protein